MRKKNLWEIVQVVIMASTWTMANAGEKDVAETFIPEPPQPIGDFDWDIVFSQGHGATLVSLSTGNSHEFNFPIAKNLHDITSSENSHLSIDTIKSEWSNFVVSSLVSDSWRNLIYFISYNPQHRLSYLAVFNITSEDTIILLQNISGIFDHLAGYMGDLYFIDNRQTIKRLNTSTVSNFSKDQAQLSPEVVVNASYAEIEGIAVDSKTGNLFWSVTGPSRILTKHGILLSNNLNRPHGLTSSDSYLYFVNTPHAGVSNKIERLAINNATNRDLVTDFKNQNQLPYSMTLLCGSLFWTDEVSKSVWRLDIPLSGSETTKIPSKLLTSSSSNYHSNTLVPYAVAARTNLDEATCISRGIIVKQNPKINKTVSTSTTTEASNVQPEVPNKMASSSLQLLPCLTIGEEKEPVCQNGGTCLSANNQIFCLCSTDFTGDNCEFQKNQSTSQTNHYEEPHATTIVESNHERDFTLLISIVVLIGISFALAVTTTLLGIKIWRGNHNPKIRRHLIVTRPASNRRQQPSSSTTVCEMLDIEDCCNMNICETPCYETANVGGIISGKQRRKSAEDNQRLLDV